MDILLPFFISFLITLIAVPLNIKLAHKFDLVDDPKKRPHPAHVHKNTLPRAGGLAIYLGIVITASLLLPLEKHLLGAILGVTFLLALGLIDDRIRNFSPYLRLILLFLAAGAAVSSGIGISFIANPLHNLGLSTQLSGQILRLDQVIIPINFFGPHYIILFADIFAFLWIVTLTQVINWSKGVDGQMPGITLVTALTLGFLSLKLFFEGDPNQLNIAKLSFVVAGSSFGFLLVNWHPAKILPGFSGSTILAFMLAILAILSGAKLGTAFLVLAIPLIDFIYTIFRRLKAGRSPVWGDRGHLHHKLLDMGWSPTQVSLFYISISAILGSVALFVNSQSKLFAILVVVITFIAFILWINSFGGLSKRQDPDSG